MVQSELPSNPFSLSPKSRRSVSRASGANGRAPNYAAQSVGGKVGGNKNYRFNIFKGTNSDLEQVEVKKIFRAGEAGEATDRHALDAANISSTVHNHITAKRSPLP